LRARWYNPADGRFQSRDTWGGIYSNPITLNRWTYTHNNPVTLTDPSGHCVPCLIAGIVIGIGIISGTSGCSKSPISPGTYTNPTVKINVWNGSAGSLGLGVVISNLNTIVTAKHVIAEDQMKDTTEIEITPFDNNTKKYLYPDLNIYYIPGKDLAVIKLPQHKPLPSSISPATPNISYSFPLYDELVSVYLDGSDNTANIKTMLTKPIGNSIQKIVNGELVTFDSLGENHGIINEGDSGGGVFSAGKLVGVNSARADDNIFTITSIALGQQYFNSPAP